MLLVSDVHVGMCRVLKAWHLYTRSLPYGMVKGRKNKVLKLTPAKINYIIRSKTNNISSRTISIDMKLSIRTVNRVWGHWVKNKEPWRPKKFGRPKTHLEDAAKLLILKIHKEQNCGARRLESIIDHKFGKHIPHNAIHQVLLKMAWQARIRKRRDVGNPGSGTRENTVLLQFILTGTPAISMAKKFVWFWTTVRDSSLLVENILRQLLTPVSILSEKHLMNTERFGRSKRLLRITEHSFSPTRKTRMVNQRAIFLYSWKRMKSSIFWPESNILRPMAKSKNGIIPTRKTENYLMILTNS